MEFARARDGVRIAPAKERVEAATWQQVNLSKPAGDSECYAANLGKAALGGVEELTCFALSIGGIKGYQRGVLVGMTSLSLDDGLKKLAQLLAWTRWVRLAARKACCCRLKIDPLGVRRKTWTGYAASPMLLRYSIGLREPSETRA